MFKLMIPTRPSNIKNRPYEVSEHSFVKLSNGDDMWIHEFYATDYASIPSILKFFLEWKGQEAGAYIVHDYMYNYSGYRTIVEKPDKKWPQYEMIKVKRKFADKEMLYHMTRLGSPRWRRRLYYIAVRLFGWRTYGTIT
jgi:hypothetical protein